MKLEQSFEVAAPVERVWQALIDVEKVAPCLPGASVTGRNEDGSYDGAFTVKIGPTSASYAGKLMMEQVDESTHTARMQANGTDKRGQGSAKASIVSTVSAAAENRAQVEVVTDYHITGRLARFGRGGMIEDISERLLREFATRLQAMLEGPGDGGSGDGDGAAEQDDPGAVGASAATTTESASGPAPTDPASGAATEPASASARVEPASASARVEPASASSQAAPPSTGPTEASSGERPAEASVDEGPTGRQRGAGPRTHAPGTSPVRTEPVPNEPIQGLSLVGSVLWERARRTPVPFAFIAGLVLAFILLGRRRH